MVPGMTTTTWGGVAVRVGVLVGVRVGLEVVVGVVVRLGVQVAVVLAVQVGDGVQVRVGVADAEAVGVTVAHKVAVGVLLVVAVLLAVTVLLRVTVVVGLWLAVTVTVPVRGGNSVSMAVATASVATDCAPARATWSNVTWVPQGGVAVDVAVREGVTEAEGGGVSLPTVAITVARVGKAVRVIWACAAPDRPATRNRPIAGRIRLL